jgi:hypothetical protein
MLLRQICPPYAMLESSPDDRATLNMTDVRWSTDAFDERVCPVGFSTVIRGGNSVCPIPCIVRTTRGGSVRDSCFCSLTPVQ